MLAIIRFHNYPIIPPTIQLGFIRQQRATTVFASEVNEAANLIEFWGG